MENEGSSLDFPSLLEGYLWRLGFSDIAPDGIATQSSLSKWSHPDDPARALRTVSGNFAFHTHRENQPWWQLDFGGPRRFQFIYIENRRPPYHNPEQKIVVETSSDGKAWEEIHQGYCSFGSDQNGVPLLVDLGDAFQARFIRARLNTSAPACLHLRRVRVFSSLADTHGGTLKAVFLATRSDGLCQRLLAIMNAKVLAHHFDGEFGFLWEDKAYLKSDRHTVSDKARIFSDPFLVRHLLQKQLGMRRLRVYADKRHDQAAFDLLMNDAREVGYFLVHQASELTASFPFLADRVSPQDYQNAFDALDFSAPIQAAVDLARHCPLPSDAIAIHVRGGDIVHGKHSYNGVYCDKALSALEIEGLVKHLPKDRSIFLIGQEQDVIDMLSVSHDNVYDGAKLVQRPHLGDEADVIFDVVLMSRMKDIYAANSAVSQLAARIGNSVFHDIANFDVTLCASPRVLSTKRYRSVSDNQKSYSLLKLVLSEIEKGDLKKALTFAERLVYFRPENVYYLVLIGLLYAENDRFDEAEQQFSAALDHRMPAPDNTLEFILTEKLSNQDIIPEALVAVLESLDLERYPISVFVHSLYRVSRGTAPDCRQRLKQVLSSVEARSPILAATLRGMG